MYILDPLVYILNEYIYHFNMMEEPKNTFNSILPTPTFCTIVVMDFISSYT